MIKRRICSPGIIVWSLFFLLSASSIVIPAETNPCPGKWTSQTVYIPVYSHLFAYGDEKAEVMMSANIIVRNTDATHAITVSQLTYYDSEGKLLKQYISGPMVIGPMASSYFLIKQADKSGGWGANFILKWSSEVPVSEPLSEVVFMGGRGNHAYSFSSQGKVLSGR